MGMFDYVDLKVPCPNCGGEIDGFQSKDGACLLDTLKFWQVNHFYSSCPYCDAWVTYTRNPKKVDLDEYELYWEKGEIEE